MDRRTLRDLTDRIAVINELLGCSYQFRPDRREVSVANAGPNWHEWRTFNGTVTELVKQMDIYIDGIKMGRKFTPKKGKKKTA
ncbi:hypothetical protein [Bacillus anthracis]|uniref:hypothetical protein n=1 Tax=Bacillus anthracis TaxID=1392 RepID=UPI002FBE1A08